MDVVARECRFVTGRTVAHGGAGDSSILTAYGVFQGMRAAAETVWGTPSLRGRRVGVEGVGKVGHRLVEHLREDGFRYRPPQPVDWLVCDMVEQPRRVAVLVAQWLREGWCRYAIFNLKLPMKKRYGEVESCLAIVREALGGDRADVRAKQLYHDREEITVFARSRDPQRPGKA